MTTVYTDSPNSGSLLSLSAKLNRAETVEAAVTHAVELADTAFDQPVVNVYEHNTETDGFRIIGSSTRVSGRTDGESDETPEQVVEQIGERTNGQSADAIPEAVVDADPRGSVQREAFVPVGRNRVLRLGTTEPDGLDEAGVTTAEGIAANLETALRGLDGQESERRRTVDQAEDDATALRRLNELTADADGFDDTIERLLSLGCEYLGLDTGILSCVDGTEYEIESVVDATGTHETGTVYDLGETMCHATLTGDRAEPLAFADVADTDHQSHPAAESVCAYTAAPVGADGETYGTVNFSMARPRAESFRPAEREFVTRISEWIGAEIERRRRLNRLEQHDVLARTASDVIITIDTDSIVRDVNPAVSDVFGYEPSELVGESLTALMPERLVDEHAAGFGRYLSTGVRNLDWDHIELPGCRADGTEIPLGVSFSEYEFEGERYFTGIIRDISESKERERELESFQQAIEKTADGVAILDDDEYVYVDQTHVDMYGFDTEDDLLGETWRELYDDDEIARLEAEAFPALESDGYWRGMVTGRRLDGSTFPAELSLTIVDDGRLVCTVRDETERRARERELELKERAMDEADVGIQITDATRDDNPLVYVNDGFERMTGYTSEEAIGQNPRFLQGADSDPEQVARLREAIDAEEPVSRELKNYRKDGTPYETRLSITPVTDENGTVTNYVGIQQDVTERRERKRRADSRADFLERMYRVTTDPETEFEEKITGLLEAGCDYLDLSEGYLSRVDMDEDQKFRINITDTVGSHELLQPGKSGPLSESYCRWAPNHEGTVALTDAAESELIPDVAYETFGFNTYVGGKVITSDGLHGTLCFASSESQDASFGQFERSLVSLLGRWVGYEIERRDAHDELRRQRERLELTLSGTNTGLTEWDLETDELKTDDTFVDLIGQDVDTAEEYFERVVHPDDREHVQETLEANLAAGEPTNTEHRVRTDGKGTRWVQAQAVPTYDGEDPVSVLAIVTDISDRKAEERERQRNERRFESLFEDPDMLVGLLDTDGTLLDANATAIEYYDVPAEDLYGEPLWNAPWWSHSDELQNDLREGIERAADGEYVDHSVTMPGPDGGHLYADGTIRPVTDDDGTVTSLVLSGRDVTERERQRKELQDRQRKLDLVLSNTDTSVAELDLENGTVRLDEMAGENAIGSPETLDEFFETVHPEDRDRVRSAIESMAGGDDPLSIESRFIEVDDSVAWVTAEAVPVTDGSGAPTGEIVGIATDITDRKARERELELKERAMDEANVGITISDPDRPDNPLIYVNDGFVEQTGYTREDALGRNCLFLQADDRDQPALDTLRDDIAAERATTVELRNYRKDGEQFWNRLSVTPVYDDGSLVNFIGVQQDVTDEVRREQRLYEEREQFRLLTESVDEYAFLTVDEDGRIQTWNAGAETLFGYDADTALGMSMAELHREADRELERPERLIQQARIAGESDDEGWRVRADGSEFYADVRYSLLESDDGEFRGYAMIVRDMTARRRQQRRTERFVEEANDVVTIVDTEGTIEYASGSADRILGYDPDDLVSENLFDYLHPESREDAMETFFTGTGDSDADLQIECRIESGDGEWLNVEMKCRNMLDDDAVGGMLLYLRDVTEDRERARRFESIFNQTYQFTGLLEPDGTLIEANDAAVDFAGVEREEIVGELFFDIQWFTHSESVRSDLIDAIKRAASGEFVRYETEVRGENGFSTIDFSAKPVMDEDDEVSLLVVEGRDITAKQRRGQHLEVMQRVMRHNIRNDLTKLRGWTQMMADERDAQARAEQFEAVERTLDKWSSMTKRIKDIRQILETQSDEWATTEPDSFIETAVSPTRRDDDDATVLTEVPDSTPIQVPEPLCEAVRELVDNAIDSRRDVTIEVELTSPEGDWIEISVRDDGPGMPEMEAEVLETGEESPLNHGQGLGLWMVRMIVTQAGGDVSVESTADGTNVRLRVPRV